MNETTGDSPAVTAIVLNWENYEMTQECLSSLGELDYQNLDVIVVDNGSRDRSGEELASEFDEVEVLFNETNRGFAGGMNRGIKYALANDAPYVWLLNNDVRVTDGSTLYNLVDRLEKKKRVGMITPRVIDSDDESWFVNGAIDESAGTTEHVKLCDVDSKFIQNDYVPFCSTLIRSRVFQDVGLLWEPFFLYYEDADFCWRVRQKGYKLETAMRETIYHYGSGSTGGISRSPISGANLGTIYSYYYTRNRILFARRLDEVNWLQFNRSYLFWVIKAVVERLLLLELESAYSILQGVFDGFRGRTGRGPYP